MAGAIFFALAAAAVGQGYDPANGIGAGHSEEFYTKAYREDAAANARAQAGRRGVPSSREVRRTPRAPSATGRNEEFRLDHTKGEIE